MTSSNQGLTIGSWSLWGFGIATIICRFVSRRMCLGSCSKYQLDDYLMLLTTIAFTGVVVSSNQVASNGSNYVPDGVEKYWSSEQIKHAEWGSKMLVALEEFMLATIWLVKACLLLLYARMTNGLRERLAVKILAVYCAIGYLIIQILYLAVWCRPVYNYWAVPVPPGHDQCKTYHNHMITVTILNISSDLAMLCIPIPLIARARLPFKRKLILCGIFSLGVLVVLVAILNRYYNFSLPNNLVFLSWYNGEAGTAVMIANIPLCWTLLRKIFSLDAWGASIKRSRTTSGPPTIGEARKRYGRRSLHSTIIGMEPSESMERITGKEPSQSSGQEFVVLEPVAADCSTQSAGLAPHKTSITKTVTIDQSWNCV